MNINLYIDDVKDNEKQFLPGREITIPELLRSRNYLTAVYGKWHLNGADWENPESWSGWTGSFPKQQGFMYGMVSKEDPHFTRELQVNTQKHPGDYFSVDGVPLGPLKGYTSDIITDSAIGFMKQNAGSTQPFFLYLPYDAVHIRIAAADKYEALYNTGNARRDTWYANITHLDDAIGRLIKAIDEMGLSENTIIFFSSDNGPDVWNQWDATLFCYGTSYPLRGHKYQLWEGGIRVPALVCWNNKIKPGIWNEPVSTLDILPTLCDLSGIALPSDRVYDGTSILPGLLKGKRIKREKPLYWQFDFARSYEVSLGEGYQRIIDGKSMVKMPLEPRASIRSGDYVLLGFSSSKFTPPISFQLYNLKEDPEQRNDIWESEKELAEKMKAELIEIFNEVNAERIKTESSIQARTVF